MDDLELSLYDARTAGIRYILRPVDKAWRVYDIVTGSYPYARPSLGRVVQDVTKAEAQAEAERLNGVSGAAVRQG